MLRPERTVVRTGLFLFAIAAVVEGISRLGHRPALHEAARWAVVAGLSVVLIPVALVGVVLGCQALFARRKGRGAP